MKTKSFFPHTFIKHLIMDCLNNYYTAFDHYTVAAFANVYKAYYQSNCGELNNYRGPP